NAPNVTVGAWRRRGPLGDPITGLALGPMHCKMIVADGAYAFVTDTNLQTHSDPVESGGEDWYQLGVVVEGEVGARLREEAADTWRGASRAVALPPAPATK